MFKSGFHPFHLVDKSPWPLFGSFCVMGVMLSYLDFSWFFLLSVGCLVLIVTAWWRDVSRESTFEGKHSLKVQNGLKLGMIMFILSEVMFFFSFFFGFFYLSLNPDIELGMNWPPVGVKSLNWSSVPLLNSFILLSSGVSITWAHHSLIDSNLTSCQAGAIWTVILGILFSFFQYLEYLESSFSICDSAFGSVFYIATGFHGLHVLIGTMFITISILRMLKNHFQPKNHLGFEMSIWYWHFVDVVWLFLFISIYWWGS